MRTERFIRRIRIEAPAQEVFRWHVRPGALERLTPPWEAMTLSEPTRGVKSGERITCVVRLGPLRSRCVAEIRECEDGRFFHDVHLAGPFARWEHRHRFEPDGPNACILEDHVEYALPSGWLGHLMVGAAVQRRIERMFAYRHRLTPQDLAAHRQCGGHAAMRIAVTGSHGFIGSALVPFLTTGGHHVTRLVRRTPKPGQPEVRWDPATGAIDPPGLEGVEAVIHLAGESLVSGRWTAERKVLLRDSRVVGTRRLCESLARLTRPPKVLVCASAIGYYGDRGEEPLDETSPTGRGFLAELCQAWEAATAPAAARGIRVVNLRIGIVLSPAGGALGKMLTPFRLGLGGPLGSGRQVMSWIAMDDLIGAFHQALMTETLSGPVNAVAPQPRTNREFTTTLGRVLRRPAILPAPAVALHLLLGELADEALLSSAHVRPAKLVSSGYTFRCPELEGALRHVLGR